MKAVRGIMKKRTKIILIAVAAIVALPLMVFGAVTLHGEAYRRQRTISPFVFVRSFNGEYQNSLAFPYKDGCIYCRGSDGLLCYDTETESEIIPEVRNVISMCMCGDELFALTADSLYRVSFADGIVTTELPYEDIAGLLLIRSGEAPRSFIVRDGCVWLTDAASDARTFAGSCNAVKIYPEIGGETEDIPVVRFGGAALESLSGGLSVTTPDGLTAVTVLGSDEDTRGRENTVSPGRIREAGGSLIFAATDYKTTGSPYLVSSIDHPISKIKKQTLYRYDPADGTTKEIYTVKKNEIIVSVYDTGFVTYTKSAFGGTFTRYDFEGRATMSMKAKRGLDPFGKYEISAVGKKIYVFDRDLVLLEIADLS